MSSSNTSIALVATINESFIKFVQCWSIVHFGLGIVGHGLSIYTFTRPALNRNACARYFLASAVSGWFIVCTTIPIRFLQFVYNINIVMRSLFLCKFVSYILACERVIPSWFVVLACVDRSRSATLRGWSSVRVTITTIPLTVVFVLVIFIHVPFYYTVQPSQSLCFGLPGAYQTFFSMWNLIFWSWLPTCCMLCFGLLTVRNVRKGRTRVAPVNIQNQLQPKQKKTDRQLIHMLLVQSFVFGMTTTPYSFAVIYFSINTTTTDVVQKAINSLVLNVFSYVALTGPCLSFYLFTLSSQLFRRELKQLFRYRHRAQGANATNAIEMLERNN